mmetsp:Transcript_28871/g.93958  ORF Transcript_28871/g.93958 Transcript_28871/m.93958 type:complete len:241 (+) Transcript_28871:166-888(+)
MPGPSSSGQLLQPDASAVDSKQVANELAKVDSAIGLEVEGELAVVELVLRVHYRHGQRPLLHLGPAKLHRLRLCLSLARQLVELRLERPTQQLLAAQPALRLPSVHQLPPKLLLAQQPHNPTQVHPAIRVHFHQVPLRHRQLRRVGRVQQERAAATAFELHVAVSAGADGGGGAARLRRVWWRRQATHHTRVCARARTTRLRLRLRLRRCCCRCCGSRAAVRRGGVGRLSPSSLRRRPLP